MKSDIIFCPKDALVRAYMPEIKVTIIETFEPNERMSVYFLVRYPHTSIGMSIQVVSKNGGTVLDTKMFYNNRDTSPVKLLDTLFGVPVEDAMDLIGSLVSELFDRLDYVGAYDVSDDMQAILPWSEKIKPSKAKTKTAPAVKVG